MPRAPFKKKGRSKPVDIELGKRLTRIRHEHNVTQKSLAAALGMTFQQIQKYESGKNRMAVSTLLKICSYLGVSYDRFLACLDEKI